MVAVCRPEMTDPSFSGLSADTNGQRDKRLEQRPDHGRARRGEECAFGQVQEPGRERRVGQMMLRRLLEARQRTPTHAPTSNWIKQPKLRLAMVPRSHWHGFYATSSIRSTRPLADARPKAVWVALPAAETARDRHLPLTPCADRGDERGYVHRLRGYKWRSLPPYG